MQAENSCRNTVGPIIMVAMAQLSALVEPKIRYLAQFLVLVIVTSLTQPAAGDEPIPGRWHVLEPGGQLFLPRYAELYGVGILTTDGTIARLYLVPQEKGAVVSLTLPEAPPADTLTSTLVTRNDGNFIRDIGSDDLLISQADGQNDLSFSFAISHKDIHLFMEARTWEVTIGPRSFRIPLKGSRAAISDVRSRLAEETSPVAEGSN